MKRIILQSSIMVTISILAFSGLSYFSAYASIDDSHMKNNLMVGKIMMKTNGMLSSPLKQFKHGTSISDIKCKEDFSLVLKTSDGSPSCVKISSVKTLVERGWAKSHTMTGMPNHDMTSNKDSMNSNQTMKKTMMQNNSSNDMSTSAIDESQYQSAPTLVGISDYINTTPAKLAQDMKGKVIVYDFWTFNCINCIHTLSHVVDLSNKYAGKGVLVIGIHSPETFFEKDINNLKEAVEKYGIKYPVVTDNNFQTWNAFGNRYWPHVYVADPQGKIRYDHIGEGGYDEIDMTVGNLLLEQENKQPKELVMG